MINYLKGRLVKKDPTHVVVETNGGVGYEAKISLATYGAIKNLNDVLLFTHLHVKEDAHTLYGFAEESEKIRFLDLISISGVGPSTGQMILSSLTPEELQSAIANEDVKTIQGVKGIGSKTAQRIVLELKDKMRKEGLIEKSTQFTQQGGNTMQIEALSALTTLGFNKAVAEKNIALVLKETGHEVSLEELIKRVLKRA
ncbi:Holliday junction branch migration protein RuvA [Marinoscillum sp. MHG1-6]|uniref:Holliday junction branch migration protein RuvA n=1 Tax=Marinoscillum sp. MHG1-6 TaxID=2959627 RepID=UPI0021572118|nr:Holliday junction branch migration protein RuvA [Marinoscillum sp. MHG1-6]